MEAIRHRSGRDDQRPKRRLSSSIIAVLVLTFGLARLGSSQQVRLPASRPG
jgi:hypothetical protein